MLATACGYDLPTIDAMTMQDFLDLSAYWQDHPPLHVLAAAWMGIKRQKPRTETGLGPLLGVDMERGGVMRV